METNYPSNAHRAKEDLTTNKTEKKKVAKVVAGQVKTKKKSGLSKLLSGIIAEDIADIKTHIIRDVVIPTIKRSISDVIDMVLYGGSSKRRPGGGTRVDYRSFYSSEPIRRTETKVVSGYTYDDVILASRGEAEEVLDQLNALIDTYGIASVADLYDLVGVARNYTDNKYGWTNLASAGVDRTREGYVIKLPRALPIK